MMRKILSLCAAFSLMGGMLSAQAIAAPSGKTAQGTGASQATVVAPAAMTNTGEMRFGQFVQPSGAGTLTLTPAGAMSGTGAVSGNQLIAQTGGGPQPGTFAITSNLNQAFTVYGPISTTITNGGASMTISNLTGTLTQTGANATNSFYTLNVGGRLNVNANQAVGTYTGSYTLTTIYL
jgi:hypothetical protein